MNNICRTHTNISTSTGNCRVSSVGIGDIGDDVNKNPKVKTKQQQLAEVHKIDIHHYAQRTFMTALLNNQ